MSTSYQQTVPLTPMVKKLIVANVVIWVAGVLILNRHVFHDNEFVELFGLTPRDVLLEHFRLWQPLTYMFLHATTPFHVLFNMLSLWWFGSELEQRWGKRFFLGYYLTCGVGAGLIYLAGAFLYYQVTGHTSLMEQALVGASGGVYGLLLAYGLLFGERVIAFMMLFPMKAKYFVMIIGVVELVTMLEHGGASDTSNLAHLGGIVVGFLYLSVVARLRMNGKPSSGSKRGRKLKLVVNNERESKPPDEPKYWN